MKKALLTRIWVPVLACPFLFFASCKQESKTADTTRHFAVDPAFKDNVPFRDFTVNSDDEDTLQLEDGTSIYIPKGIFVDANGNKVTGDVQLHYRSFYTAGQIMASGITMFYDTAGAKTVFTSAGMFELTGTQNGQTVSIAPGKNIAMDFASSKNDQPYNFYALDTANAQWSFLSATTAEPNAIRERLEAALASVFSRPVEPQKFDPKKPVIDLDVNIDDHPELKGYAGLMWQYAGTGTDPEQNTWIYDEDWQNAKLTMLDTNTCMYDLKLSDNTRSFSTHVVPAIRGANYDVAIKKYKSDLLTFEAGERDRQANRKEVALTQQFQRRILVPRFGISNCDRPGLSILRKWLHSRFHFTAKNFEDHKESVAVFVATSDGAIVSEYNGAEAPDVFYIDGSKTCVVAVLRGTNEVEVMDSNAFASAAKTDPNATVDLNMISTSTPVSNSDDLDALLRKL